MDKRDMVKARIDRIKNNPDWKWKTDEAKAILAKMSQEEKLAAIEKKYQAAKKRIMKKGAK